MAKMSEDFLERSLDMCREFDYCGPLVAQADRDAFPAPSPAFLSDSDDSTRVYATPREGALRRFMRYVANPPPAAN